MDGGNKILPMSVIDQKKEHKSIEKSIEKLEKEEPDQIQTEKRETESN